MNKLLKRLRRINNDAGISLIEVVIATLVFSILALGAGYSTITVIKITQDTRSRQVATALATTELDAARAVEDPFDIVNGSRQTTISGRVYTIAKSTSWVETSGADVGCGTGTGTLQAKRVNVTVTWAGMLNTTPPVRSDTLISPDDRINDPSLGTIRISVLSVAGTGASGVAVAITPVSGGAIAVDKQPDNTDSDGCSYALKVTPGTYKVAISRSGSIDNAQVTAPFKNVVVTAGGSVATQFQYDYAATFNLTYANGSAKTPTNLDTSYLSTYGVYVDSVKKSSVGLHPYPSGYAGIAGKYIAPVSGNAGCVSVDPAAWPAATVNGTALAQGTRTAAVAAAPKGSVNMTIPMGVITVTNSGNYTLTAESATAAATAADPGCATGMSYTFGAVSGNQTIALPYGSWTLYQTVAGIKTAIPANKVGLVGGLLSLLGIGNVFTLDPRNPA